VFVPAVAAAAVIALLVARPFGPETTPDSASRFREPASLADQEDGVEIQIVAPADDEVVSAASLTFVWHAVGTGASYQLTVTDGEGGVVWTLATIDTVAALPDTVTLARASLYYWYVDGLVEDARHASSGVHSFTTRG
jgi:hypothetical protein